MGCTSPEPECPDRGLVNHLPPLRRSFSATYRITATTTMAGRKAGIASRSMWWPRYSTCVSVIVLTYPGGPHVLRPLPYFEHRFVQPATTVRRGAALRGRRLTCRGVPGDASGN